MSHLKGLMSNTLGAVLAGIGIGAGVAVAASEKDEEKAN